MKALGSGESRLETVISALLIGGIAASLALILLGVVFFYTSNGSLAVSLGDKALYITGRNFFSLIYELISGRYTQDNSILFIALGIVVMLLTVYARVVVSVIYFAVRKDAKYTILTGLVLVAITLSLALH